MKFSKLLSIVVFLVVLMIFIGPAPSFAQDPANGDTFTIVDGCMQDAAGFALNCTANDVSIAEATNIEIIDPCEYPGDDVTFKATFIMHTTAVTRHDIGVYFSIDGDPGFCENDPGTPCEADQNCADAGVGGACIHDGAYTGNCSISTLPYGLDPPWLDLDGTNDDPAGIVQDTCGDIGKKGYNDLEPIVTITAKCIDRDGDGFLDLPYCVSWRQFGANELCESPLDAFPGSPSKCKCDAGFNVEVPVPKASLTVTKTVNPSAVPEPGGGDPVKYTVSIKNDSVDPANNVTIDQVTDDVYGNLLDSSNSDVSSNTCPSLDKEIGPGETVTCSFEAVVSGDAGYSVKDTVTASGLDIRGNRSTGSDDATVTVTDVLPKITVTKTGDTNWVYEPGGSVTFTVKVEADSTNVSTDDVTIKSLVDDVHGDLSLLGTCTDAVGTVLAAGQSYSCTFSADVNGNAGYSETDKVTATATDNEGNVAQDDDSWIVEVRDVAPTIDLTKTANVTEINEPGDDVEFTYVVTNKSFESVTITSIEDDKHTGLSGEGTCTDAIGKVLAPSGQAGDSYTCKATFKVTGNAGYSETDTAKACAVDNDGTENCAQDSETVTILNVAPAASLTKSVTEVLVTYTVKVCNDSDAEALTLNALNDNIYNNITTTGHDGITETTCSVPQTLEPAGEANDCYSCWFKASTTTSPTTDTVTGTVDDDDGSTSVTPSDSATVSFE